MLTIIKTLKKSSILVHRVLVSNPFFSISRPGFQRSSPGFLEDECGFFLGPGFSPVWIFFESGFRSMPTEAPWLERCTGVAGSPEGLKLNFSQLLLVRSKMYIINLRSNIPSTMYNYVQQHNTFH